MEINNLPLLKAKAKFIDTWIYLQLKILHTHLLTKSKEKRLWLDYHNSGADGEKLYLRWTEIAFLQISRISRRDAAEL